MQQQEAALLDSGHHVVKSCGQVPKGGHCEVAHQEVSLTQAAGGGACRVPLALGHVMLLKLSLGRLQGLGVAISGHVFQLRHGLGVEQCRNAGVQVAITSQHLEGTDS